MKNSQEAHTLGELIRKAMDDLEITPKEYEQIILQAGRDKHVDAAERALLQQFHAMISDGTIKRVAR